MKKLLILIAAIILILCFFKTEEVIIPSESIRFRIIANSNSIKDQNVKKEIVKSLNNKIDLISNKASSIEEARASVQKAIPTIEKEVNDKIKELDYNKNISINYGKNYFPQKNYRGIVYPEGKYESLVITIGDGIGENFWCILFPPLCNIDESVTDVEYTSLIKEIINKYKK